MADPKTNILPKRYTVPEVAAHFRRSPRTILVWVSKGLLRPIRAGSPRRYLFTAEAISEAESNFRDADSRGRE